ncbi:MFS transporter [Cohnella lubricantis]|uniref:MFS transporter n=1 Tax=Cohnella lubricantis TaxID=2163172 RepID=A0A841T7H6_9BACL|nr:MFS transporter [Cohnella lubricantis]MBB6676006.1 MFS transporter [Cohnella lubricantis]MBP2117981.1 MFS family permease [Cohnella lubricantis]
MELQRQDALAIPAVKKQVWTNARFLVLWLASAFTNLAFSVYLLTESWYVVQRLGLENWLGIVMMTTTIPRVLLMTFAGVLADRIRRSTILAYANGIRVVFVAAMVILVMENALSIWGLLGFALIYGVLDAFHGPASSSMLPNIVEREHLVRGNSILQTTNQLTLLFGPALAGLLMKFASFEASFAAAAAFLLVGAAAVRFLRDPGPSAEKQREPFLRQLKDGIVYMKSFPFLLTLMIVSMILNMLFAGPVSSGVPILVNRAFAGDVLALSYMESAIAFGMMGGAAWVGIMQPKRRRGVLAMFFVTLSGVGVVLLSLITEVWQGVALMFAMGFFIALCNVLIATLIQQMVRPDMMGRVQGVLGTTAMGLMPVSLAIVSALLSAGIGISGIMLTAGLIMVAFMVIILATVKSVRTVD